MCKGACATVGDPASLCPCSFSSVSLFLEQPKIPFSTPDPGTPVARNQLPPESDASILLVISSSPLHGSIDPEEMAKQGVTWGTAQ